VFTLYQWDFLNFLKTIFYWAPVYDPNPLQFQGGCMNIWSFAGLFGVDISKIAILRFLWIPVLGAAILYWFRKRSITDSDLILSIISFYLLFMISYGWVTEQTFLDPLPFIFLQIIAYRPKRAYLLALTGLQTLVYLFTLFNGAPLIFEPLFAKFFPEAISPVENLSSANSTIFWQVRGVLGFAISISLALFLVHLLDPTFLEKSKQRLARFRNQDF
jgi:hypothetical protein